jgi:hypothetical protein
MVPSTEPLSMMMLKIQSNKKAQHFEYTLTIMAMATVALPISLFSYANSLKIVIMRLRKSWLECQRTSSFFGWLLIPSFLSANYRTAVGK